MGSPLDRRREASQAQRAFEQLLDEELEAALRADVDALIELQEPKRVALEALRAAPVEEESLEALRESARANVRLIRHLSECLRGLADGGNTLLYGARGRSFRMPRMGQRRGAV